MESKLAAFINCNKFKTCALLQPAVENSTAEPTIAAKQIFNDSALTIQNLATNIFLEETIKLTLLLTITILKKFVRDSGKPYKYGCFTKSLPLF